MQFAMQEFGWVTQHLRKAVSTILVHSLELNLLLLRCWVTQQIGLCYCHWILHCKLQLEWISIRILLSDSTSKSRFVPLYYARIYCLNCFAKMLSLPKFNMDCASDWYSFQCNLQCSIQTGVEFCWMTQHFQKQICSTLLFKSIV